jgi:hypothetical protein
MIFCKKSDFPAQAARLAFSRRPMGGRDNNRKGETKMIKRSTIVMALVAATTVTGPAFAQQPAAAPAEAPRPGTTVAPVAPPTPMPAGVVPLRNQTGDQAQLDVSQCQNLASQATGYIPNATTAPTTASSPQMGGRAKGAAKGAAVGGVAGAVQDSNQPYRPNNSAGDMAGAGAAAGAVAGGMNQRQDRRKSTAEQKKAAEAQAQKATAWQNNYAGCLQQRGYTLQ